jgi:hypothetical protein
MANSRPGRLINRESGSLPVIWDLSTSPPTLIEIMDYSLLTGVTVFGGGMATAISDDGTVVAGYLDLDGQRKGFRWISAGGMVVIATGFQADTMNGDGTVITGGRHYWSEDTGFVEFADVLAANGLSGQSAGWAITRIYDVSRDAQSFTGYGINFNNDPSGSTIEGFYVSLNADPVADAGLDQIVECEGELTPVQLNGAGSLDPENEQLQFEWSGATFDDPTSPTPVGLFPFGPTLVTLTVTDGQGGIGIDDVLVTVQDTTPPVLICTTNEIALWPPNHQMREVDVFIAVSDNCAEPDQLDFNCTVSSNEPDNSGGDGSTTGDVNGHDGYSSPVNISDALSYDAELGGYTGTISLRAERAGATAGRVYSIVCEVVDTEDNSATASCVVVVPHDKRKK